jgi:hypothetical protein
MLKFQYYVILLHYSAVTAVNDAPIVDNDTKYYSKRQSDSRRETTDTGDGRRNIGGGNHRTGVGARGTVRN